MNPKNAELLKVVAFSLFVSFLLYGNTIRNGFSMDDELVTTTDRKSHPLVEKGVLGLGEILTSFYEKNEKQQYGYRPLTTYSFAVEWSLFQNNENRASISHFINILLYAISGIILFVFLRKLLRNKQQTVIYLAVFIFLIHPIHSEVVNNLKSRDELLSLIFALTSAVFFLKYVDSEKAMKWLILSLIVFLFSILSKINGLTFAAILPMALYFFRKIKLSRAITFMLMLGGVFLLFRVFKFFALDSSSQRVFEYFENPLYHMEFLDRIPMFFYSIFLYIEKLIIPYPLTYYYGYDAIEIVDFSSPMFYISLLICLLLLSIALKGLLQRKEVAFWILFFFLAIGGAANLISPVVGVFAERFAFFASIAFCVLLAQGLHIGIGIAVNNKRKPKILAIIAIVLFIPSMLFAHQRNEVWYSKKSLYLNDIQYVPNSAKANTLLGSEYLHEARTLFNNKKISDYPLMREKSDSAEVYYENGVQIYENYTSAYNNLASIQFTFKNDISSALKNFDMAVTIDSLYFEGWLNKAKVYEQLAATFKNISQPDTNRLAKSLNGEYDSRELINALFRLRLLKEQGAKILSRETNQQTLKAFHVIFKRYLHDDKILSIAFQDRGVMKEIILNRQEGKFLEKVELIQHLLIETLFTVKSIKETTAEIHEAYADSLLVSLQKAFNIEPKKELIKFATNFCFENKHYKGLIQWSYKELIRQDYSATQKAQASLAIANSYYSLSEIDSTNKYFEKGIDYLLQRSSEADIKEVINIYNHLVRVNEESGNIKEANYYNYKREKIMNELGNY